MASYGDGASGVRIVARTPRNIAPILDAGTSHLLKRLLQDTFASAAGRFAPDRLKGFSHEIAASLAFYFHFVSLVRDSGTVGESLFWIVREELLEISDPHQQSGGILGLRLGRNVTARVLAALAHVSGPYLNSKLSEARDQYLALGDTSLTPIQEIFRERRWSELFSLYYWKKALVKVYPSYRLGLGLFDVWQRIMFTAGRSSWPTFEHALVETAVRRLTFREFQDQNKLRSFARERKLRAIQLRQLNGSASVSKVKNWLALTLLKGRHFAEDYNKTLLLVLACSCKVLEWWYSSGEAAAKIPGKALPAPPAPRPKSEEEGGMKLPKSPKLCPICKKVKTNPTVLTVSGYVFCYNCIMLEVKQHKRCPVTLSPAGEEQVRRLYFT